MAGEITQMGSLLIFLFIYTIGTELGTPALAVSEAPHPRAKTPKPAFGQHGERERVVVWWFVRVLWHLTAQMTGIRSERPQSGVVFRCFMLISKTIGEIIKRKGKHRTTITKDPKNRGVACTHSTRTCPQKNAQIRLFMRLAPSRHRRTCRSAASPGPRSGSGDETRKLVGRQ